MCMIKMGSQIGFIPVFIGSDTRSTVLPLNSNNDTIVLYRATVEDPVGVTFTLKSGLNDDYNLFTIYSGIIMLNNAITTLPPSADPSNNVGVYDITVTATNRNGSVDRPIQLTLSFPYIPSESGFSIGRYYIEYNAFEYQLSFDEQLTSTSKSIQENLLSIIRELVIIQIKTTFDCPADVSENRPYLFYDPSNPSMSLAQTLKNYLSPGYETHVIEINKVVDRVYDSMKSFIRSFFTPDRSGFQCRLVFSSTSNLILVGMVST